MLKFRKKLAEKKEASKGIAKAGFTLIELLVVIVILGILVLLAVPRFLGYSKDAEVAAMQADAKVLANAALIYNVENDGWPVEVDEEGNPVEAFPDNPAFLKLNEDDFKDSVQTLKNDFEDYALVAETFVFGGNAIFVQEGEIIFLGNGEEGVKDKDGNIHLGVDIEIPADPVEDVPEI